MKAQFANLISSFTLPELSPEIITTIKITLGMMAIFWFLYFISTTALKRYVLTYSLKRINAKQFLLLWRYAWLTIGGLLIAIVISGSLTTLGISAAFLGMILGWSLQAPVTGIAGWLMVILKRPFRIGDRIIVDGVIGDVVDINLTHVTLNQVGGTVSGEEQSGRSVLFPNALLFQKSIFNYTYQKKFILDEVTLTVTYSSDIDDAEKIFIDAATEITKEIIDKEKTPPYIRLEFADSGVRVRLRYLAKAVERQEVSSDITRIIIKKVNNIASVDFAYPHMQLIR